MLATTQVSVDLGQRELQQDLVVSRQGVYVVGQLIQGGKTWIISGEVPQLHAMEVRAGIARRPPNRFVESIGRLIKAAKLHEHIALVIEHIWIAWLDRPRPVIGGECVLQAPQLHQHVTAVDERLGVAGIDRQRRVAALQGITQAVQGNQKNGAIVQRFDITRLERNCPVVARQRFPMAP